MTTVNKVLRTLSAFNPSTRSWAPVSPTNTPSKASSQKLSFITWNIDAFSSGQVERARLILGRMLEGPTPPDIIFLQEVTTDVREFLLDDESVRAAFLATDAEDATAFKNVPFATMILLSKARFSSSDLDSQKEQEDANETGGKKLMLGQVFRLKFPSHYRRDGLCVEFIRSTAPDTVFRLITVHLDSLSHTFNYRAKQLEILAGVLREPGCGGGIIAGDFNAISPEDHELLDKNGLVDAWVALRGNADPDAATWGVGMERPRGLEPGRLDKVAMLGLKATEIDVLRCGFIEEPMPGEKSVEIPWSDHSGMRCSFTF